MRFLLDANLPRSTATLLRQLGHQAVEVREVLPPGAEDSRVAAYAQEHQLALVTRDFDFSDVRNYPPADYFGLVVLEVPDDATASQINQVLQVFASDASLLSRLPGRLAIVETWRVRFRPA